MNYINALILLNTKQNKLQEVNNLVSEAEIQQCIDRCTQNAMKVRSIANEMVNHRGRYALAEADRNIELSIHLCLDAKEKLK
ncbi:hypothetical protein [Dethiobacter alkaliphilus]|uniref:Uncharacterized protein n=1 Tax=Dethiobacter alkaliphilus AHT 1 TaxID=555088 RepID=C0GK40_DETAL|nr:hypothetical protein [Dethiobacter alkaliphilus]EEG76310.1 hypothetical protein DealDRAFT_2849 [Dethiobacter alkaliphilus AHT 1]